MQKKNRLFARIDSSIRNETQSLIENNRVLSQDLIDRAMLLRLEGKRESVYTNKHLIHVWMDPL